MAQMFPGMEAKDVTEFHFRQMTRYQLQNDNEHISKFPKTPIQRLAVSNKLGKVFAGCHDTLVSVNLSELEKNDEIASNVKSSAITPSKMMKVLQGGSKVTQLPSTPTHLGINADEKTLAVALNLPSTGKPHIYLFDTRSFSVEETLVVGSVKPFLEVPASTRPGINIVELSWNPVLPSMFAVVFSDGSLALHMLSEKGFDTATLPAAEKICCVSWSPKGKQLVVGKLNGSLTQYKPDLKEFKKIPHPLNSSDPGTPLIASSILWVSTYQFLVLYKTPSNIASLCLVQSSKSGDTKYYNYEDICYSTGDSRDPYFMMYQQMDWPLIFCASSNGIEVALMGVTGTPENASWQQWSLEDAGRAELPLVSSTNEERYPVGMAFCWGGVNRCLPMDEAGNCMPHPVPILFLLTPDGMLCGFYAAYKGAVQVTKPLDPITGTARVGMIELPRAINFQTEKSSSAVQMNSAGGIKVNLNTKFDALQTEERKPVPSIPTGMSKSSFPGFGLSSVGLQPTMPNQPVVASTPIKSTAFSVSSQSKADSTTQKPNIGEASISISKQYTGVSSIPIKPQSTSNEGMKIGTDKSSALASSNSATVKHVQSEERYQALIREEILSFESELRAFKSRVANLNINVGSNDEKVELKKGLADMECFRKLLIETTTSQCREISQLKKGSLENCQWLEEAKSRQIRNKDPRYLQLLKGRALDPHSQKQLAKVQSKFMYLDQQINEINNKLDLEWEAHCRKTNMQVTGRGSARRQQIDCAPSMETIYRVLQNHHTIIDKQKTTGEKLATDVKELNLNNISTTWKALKASPYRGRSARVIDDDELTRLADSLLEKTTLREGNTNRNETTRSKISTNTLSPIIGFSPEKENKLRALLAARGTTKITCKPPIVSQTLDNNTFASPEKASKNLLSSLHKYKDLSLVPETPKNTALQPVIQSNQGSLQNKITNTNKLVTPQPGPTGSNMSIIKSSIATNTKSVFSNPTVPSTSINLLASNLSVLPTSNTLNVNTSKPAFTHTALEPTTFPKVETLPRNPTSDTSSSNLPLFDNNASTTGFGNVADAVVAQTIAKSTATLEPKITKVTSTLSFDENIQTSALKPNRSSYNVLPVTSSFSTPVTTPYLTNSAFQASNVIASSIKPADSNTNTADSVPFTFLPSNSKSIAPTPKSIFGTVSSISSEATSFQAMDKEKSKQTSIFGGSGLSTSSTLPAFNFSGASSIALPTMPSSVTVTPITTKPIIPDASSATVLNSLTNVTDDKSTKLAPTVTVPGHGGTEKPSTSSFEAISNTVATTTESASLFPKQLATSKSSAGIFGATAQSTESSIFSSNEKDGSSVFGTSASSGTSIFGGNSSGSSTLFGNATKPAGTTSNTLFGGGEVTKTASSIFGGQPKVPDKTQIASSPVTTLASNTSSSTSIFGASTLQVSENPTVSAASTASSIFGGNTETKSTSASSGGSIFGGGGGFFSGLGSAPPAESSSKNVFGATPTAGGSIFGGGGTPNTLFGTPSSTSVTSSNTTPIFGGNNVSNAFGAPKPSSGFGTFSSGSTNVASQGFGVSQQPTTPVKPVSHSFGAAATFGSSPTGTSTPAASAFGGTPAFGTSPTFGGTPAFGSAASGSVFGGTAPNTQTFGALGSANSNAQTFGTVGAQSPGGSTFGSLSSNPPAFGVAASNTPGGFGGAASNTPGGFGGAASNTPGGFGGFGSATTPSSNMFGGQGGGTTPSSGGASFSSWR